MPVTFCWLFFGGLVKKMVPTFLFGQDVALVVQAVIAPDFFLAVRDEVTAIKRFVQHIHDGGARSGAAITQDTGTHDIGAGIELNGYDG